MKKLSLELGHPSWAHYWVVVMWATLSKLKHLWIGQP